MDQFGYMYTIEFLSGGYKMFQREIFDTSPDTFIFTMNIKYLDSQLIESSPQKNNIFQQPMKIIHTHLALKNWI